MNGLYEATASRSIDVELEGDVIAVDLDNLDPDASDILDLLKEAESPVWIWARIAGEYWRKGHLVTAEGICKTAIEGGFTYGRSGLC
jgi:RNA polymerase-associated protein CTR9